MSRFSCGDGPRLAAFWVAIVAWAGVYANCPARVQADEKEAWIMLSTPDFAAWQAQYGWKSIADAHLDSANPRRFAVEPGTGAIYNGATGRTVNLVTKRAFGDLELHCEFMIPKGSNSGVKFQGIYEIQILDSFGVKQPLGQDCGGIYPRAAFLPTYHYLDKGKPPRVNACKPAGEWQTLDASFRAPRFDADGKKTSDARIVRATLNGVLIQEDVEVPYATGAAWNKAKEHAVGPLLLQADHGPVAFRNLRVRPLPAGEARSAPSSPR